MRGRVGFRVWSCVMLMAAVLSSSGQELFESTETLSPELDRMYVGGLRYLIETQNAEGYWSDSQYGKEPAVVGLAVVSMLAHGDDPNFGPYAEGIRRGLDYILKQQNPKNGYIGTSMYNHGFAALALAEAYGVVNDARLGPALVKAVELIVESQKQNPFGAWRYSPESKDADTTVTGSQLVSLFAARNAGISVPQEAIDKGLEFILSCQTADGGIGYTSPTSPNGARTAIGSLCLALADRKESPNFKRAFEYLNRAPTESNYQQYYLYYAAQAFFHGSARSWAEWNRENIRMLKNTQNQDGSWEGTFGVAFGTSASLLSLALNYRFLPIYER